MNVLIINIAVTSNFFPGICFIDFWDVKSTIFEIFYRGFFEKMPFLDIFCWFPGPVSNVFCIFSGFSCVVLVRFEFLIKFYIDYSGLEFFFICFYLSVVEEKQNTCCKLFIFQIAQNRVFAPFSSKFANDYNCCKIWWGIQPRKKNPKKCRI